MADFDLTVLGCGSALPTTRHWASSQIIDLRDKLYMIDCGEAAQVQMWRGGADYHAAPRHTDGAPVQHLHLPPAW